ncbi:MAG: hypothetical protein P8N61_04075, partial [Porticoccaceae bacterium]|nr:hypothetical protein [Porticoccaceae bacterium]
GMRIAAYGSKSGVVTATHELNLGGIISYADKLDARSLAQAMSSSIKSIRDPRLDATAKSVSQLYSWKRLLDRLIE